VRFVRGKPLKTYFLFFTVFLLLVLIQTLTAKPLTQGALPKVREASSQADQAKIQADIVELPISFIANAGQVDADVRFMVKAATHTIFFTPQEVVFTASDKAENGDSRSSVVRLSFNGANESLTIEGQETLSGVANFFLGNDPFS